MKKRVRILMLFILFFSAVTPAYATVTSTIETSGIEEISGTQEQGFCCKLIKIQRLPRFLINLSCRSE